MDGRICTIKSSRVYGFIEKEFGVVGNNYATPQSTCRSGCLACCRCCGYPAGIEAAYKRQLSQILLLYEQN